MTSTIPPKTGRGDHSHRAIQGHAAASTTQLPTRSQGGIDTHDSGAAGGAKFSEPAMAESKTIVAAPARATYSVVDQNKGDSHFSLVDDGPTSPISFSATIDEAGEGQSGSAKARTKPILASPDLADPLLALAADVLDDLERVRIANENRLRQLTRTESDKDGAERGFGLTLDHPDVARLAALVELLKDAEKKASANLKFRVKRHPLGKWIAATKGVGEQQAARLLATIGDPYWNDLHERPRLVSELWSYAGFGDAARQVRQRGVKANWSDDAKKRAWLIASKIVMIGGPYRVVYDEAREKYAEATHTAVCKRCGPSGKPAQPGSPLSDGHKHARALRIVAKSVLRDMWREAKRIHEGD